MTRATIYLVIVGSQLNHEVARNELASNELARNKLARNKDAHKQEGEPVGRRGLF